MRQVILGTLLSLISLFFLFFTFVTVNGATPEEQKLNSKNGIIRASNFSSQKNLTEMEMLPTDINTMMQKLSMASNELNKFWNSTFQSRNWRYVSPRIIPYNTQLNTPCGPTKSGNASYCRGDHTIYFDINFFAGEMNRAGQSLGTDGDTAPIVILAHECGHAVQDILGISNEGIEYQADCFAGTFIQYSIGQGFVERGDLEEAAFSLHNAGDDAWLYRHGTSSERVNNFMIGVRGGVTACGLR